MQIQLSKYYSSYNLETTDVLTKNETTMKKIFIINGVPQFLNSGGKLNKLLTEWTDKYFRSRDYEIKMTDLNKKYNTEEEVSKFIWADVIIYHTAAWWCQIPNGFKKYLDEVLMAGHGKGIYVSDGRHSINPTRNYGTGGSLQGRKYMLTTTWNAPEDAFTVEGEFFNQHSVDDGPMFGFHCMNAFIGLTKLPSFHFYDVSKNFEVNLSEKEYLKHLDKISDLI